MIERDVKEELKTQEYRIDKKTIKTKTNPPPEGVGMTCELRMLGFATMDLERKGRNNLIPDHERIMVKTMTKKIESMKSE